MMSEFDETSALSTVFVCVTLSDDMILVVRANMENTKKAMVRRVARLIIVWK